MSKTFLKLTVDAVGRVCIPKWIRDELKLDIGDKLDLDFDGVNITLYRGDFTELDSHIKYIEGIASDSYNINRLEMVELNRLLNKLAGKEVG